MSKRLAKKILQTAPAAAIARMLTRKRPAILMYHGLTSNANIRDWTQVAVADFAAQMKHVRDRYTPVSLDQLAEMLETDSFIPHAVAITFDDGYKSNLDLALPILRQYRIPATVFITSMFIDGRIDPGRFLWPDIISMIFLSHPDDTIDLTSVGAGTYDLGTTEECYRARNDLVERLKSIPEKKKNTVMQLLMNSYGDQIDYDRFPEYHPLSRDELIRLAGDDLITIGAHSRTHPILSRVDRETLEDEITGGKSDIEDMVRFEVNHFAYPNGRVSDISPDAVTVVRDHFRCAFITEPGLIRSDDDKYLLRRVGIGRNIRMGEFKTLLTRVYYMMQRNITGIQSRITRG